LFTKRADALVIGNVTLKPEIIAGTDAFDGWRIDQTLLANKYSDHILERGEMVLGTPEELRAALGERTE
jgi:hypothetical protein